MGVTGTTGGPRGFQSQDSWGVPIRPVKIFVGVAFARGPSVIVVPGLGAVKEACTLILPLDGLPTPLVVGRNRDRFASPIPKPSIDTQGTRPMLARQRGLPARFERRRPMEIAALALRFNATIGCPPPSMPLRGYARPIRRAVRARRVAISILSPRWLAENSETEIPGGEMGFVDRHAVRSRPVRRGPPGQPRSHILAGK
jgi:hypothetical protein